MKFFARILIVFLLTMNGVSFAQGLGMPPKILAVISSKILSYVDNFPAKTVTIVYPETLAGQKDKVVQAFSATGLKADAVAEVDAGKASGDIIILLPGLKPESLSGLPVLKKLVISASKADTDSGNASFSIVNDNGKPKIMVNLAHVQKTHLKVSGKLYRVAQKSN